MDEDRPISSDDLIRQARAELDAVKDEILPSSEEMTEAANLAPSDTARREEEEATHSDTVATSEELTRAANRTPTPTEVEESLAAAELVLAELESEALETPSLPEPDLFDPEALALPPEPDVFFPEPAPRRPSRGDHSPADVDGPVVVTPPTQSQTPTWRRFLWLIPVVWIGVSFVGSIFEDSGTPVQDVAVGNCFDDTGEVTIESIEVIDCSAPHDFEVFSVFDIGEQFEDFPGDSILAEQAFDACIEAFEGYVGIPYAESTLWLFPLAPLEDSWQAGDHEVACLVYESPDLGASIAKATGTARSSNV